MLPVEYVVVIYKEGLNSTINRLHKSIPKSDD